MSRILILRPEPGASESADRAVARGLEPVLAPLFDVRAIAWDAPDPDSIDALMVTSANALRHGGAALAAFRHLPCYAVGHRSAEEARLQGFENLITGAWDGAALVPMIAADGHRIVFHPCGRDHIELSPPDLLIERRTVYAAEAAERLPEAAAAALRAGVPALVHSPRAAYLFAELVDRAQLNRNAIRIGAISENAARCAGSGWGELHTASEPRDEALLELARKLCNNGAGGGRQ